MAKYLGVSAENRNTGNITMGTTESGLPELLRRQLVVVT